MIKNNKQLNKDRINRHFFEYFQDVIQELEDRNVNDELEILKSVLLVQSVLDKDVNTAFDFVKDLKKNKLISKDSTIFEEIISGSECEYYDKV